MSELTKWTVHHFADQNTSDFKPGSAGLYEIEEANQEINGLWEEGKYTEASAMADANKRMIEALPDLLKVAQEWIGWTDNMLSGIHRDETLLAMIEKTHGKRIEATRAAIAKAGVK